MSERGLVAAWKIAINTALQVGNIETDPRKIPLALEFSEVQEREDAGDDAAVPLPFIYVAITLTRRFGGNPRISSHKTVRGWRLTTTFVAPSEDEARWASERVAGLEYSRPSVAGLDLSPLMFETADAPRRDGVAYSGRSEWTFSTTPV